MKSLFIVFLLVALNLCIAHAGYGFDPGKQWVRVYGGSNSDVARSIQETSVGGYIVAGYTSSFGVGNNDIWILKLEDDGQISWQKTFGGNGVDQAYAVQETSDGGYVITGYTNSFGAGSNDIWVLKLGNDGTIHWGKTYGGSDSDVAYDIQQTSDGEYIVAGCTRSFGDGDTDILVLKLDSSGNIIWQKTNGGTRTDDEAWSVRETFDGGFVVAGNTYSCGLGLRDILVLKLDSLGDLVWEKGYGGSKYDHAKSIEPTPDGGYIISGHSSDFVTGGGNIRILKLDIDGNLSWYKTFGGSHLDRSSSIHQTTDGGYIVAGTTLSFGAGSEDMWLTKLSTSGNVQWQKPFGGTGKEIAYSIQQTSDGGYIATGRTDSFNEGGVDILVLKVDSGGDIYGCDISGMSDASITDASVENSDTVLPHTTPHLTAGALSIISQNSAAEIITVCYFDPDDVDGDGIYNVVDNCPAYFNPGQEDVFPSPAGNGTGDACDCEGNFDCDEDCDGTDATIFKDDFGRSVFANSCIDEPPCLGDFDCDQDCDGTDAILFKADFGRSQFINPCPPCTVSNWCSY